LREGKGAAHSSWALAAQSLKKTLTHRGKRTPEEERKVLGLDDFEAAITKLIDDGRDRPEILGTPTANDDFVPSLHQRGCVPACNGLGSRSSLSVLLRTESSLTA
jgi:hypothetical protein